MNETEQIRNMLLELQERSIWLLSVESALFALILLTTILGNLLTVIVVYRDERLQTITNVFVISLAVSDFGLATISAPLCLVALIVSRWPFSDAVCQYQGFICIVLATASIQTLAWMAVNRYYRVVQCSKYRRYFTSRSTKAILVLIWVLAAFAPSPYFMAGNRFVFIPAKFFCYQLVNSGYFTAFMVTIYVGFPSIVITFCYLRIFEKIRSHNLNLLQSTNRVSAEEIKITKTLFVIVVLYMLCWTPVLIVDLIDTFSGRWSVPRQVYMCYSFLTLFSSMVNPFCYGIMNPSFKRGYIRVFSKILCCECLTSNVIHPTESLSIESRGSHGGTNGATPQRLTVDNGALSTSLALITIQE